MPLHLGTQNLKAGLPILALKHLERSTASVRKRVLPCLVRRASEDQCVDEPLLDGGGEGVCPAGDEVNLLNSRSRSTHSSSLGLHPRA
jgi:hypothetical protein